MIPINHPLTATNLKSWLPRAAVLCLLAFCFAGWLIAYPQHAAPDLTVHEWGTFTAVAGNDGQAVQWTPSINSDDLPGFVEHISAANFKGGLRGTIRMETPVLYFYSPRDVNASVKVSFSDGVITEWYPHAARVTPSGVLRNINLSQLQSEGSIRWDNIAVSPNLDSRFPSDEEANRYYAARDTSATPLHVSTANGEQQEKFLFYRGVSAARLPISAEQTADGKSHVEPNPRRHSLRAPRRPRRLSRGRSPRERHGSRSSHAQRHSRFAPRRS